MTYAEFKNRWIGKKVDVDRVYGAQCVDLVNQYAIDMGARTLHGNAEDIAGQYSADWLRVGFPQQGDVVVFKEEADNGWFGHVAIVDTVHSNNTLTTLDQNYPTSSNISLQKHPVSKVTGYLRPAKLQVKIGEKMNAAQALTFAFDQSYLALGMHVPKPGENTKRAESVGDYSEGYNAIINDQAQEARLHLQDYIYRIYKMAFGPDRKVDMNIDIKPRVDRIIGRQTTFYDEIVDIMKSEEFTKSARNKPSK